MKYLLITLVVLGLSSCGDVDPTQDVNSKIDLEEHYEIMSQVDSMNIYHVVIDQDYIYAIEYNTDNVVVRQKNQSGELDTTLLILLIVFI